MPTLEHKDAIEQYWELVKSKYPYISFRGFEVVCKAPFEFIKSCMRDDSLPIILIKYLGKIRPIRTKILKQIRFIESKTDEYSKEKIEFLSSYLDELTEYDENRYKTYKEEGEDSEAA